MPPSFSVHRAKFRRHTNFGMYIVLELGGIPISVCIRCSKNSMIYVYKSRYLRRAEVGGPRRAIHISPRYRETRIHVRFGVPYKVQLLTCALRIHTSIKLTLLNKVYANLLCPWARQYFTAS